jgi:alpha-L-fucosidase
MLLNVGPRPDGTIPEQARQVLLDMGKWLEVNGEAIYGTRPWKIFGEGPTKVGGGKRVRREVDYTAADIRFTTKDDTLYAICLDWPDGQLVVTSLGSKSKHLDGSIAAVTLVGYNGELTFSQEERGLVVTMPDKKPCNCAYALKITWK